MVRNILQMIITAFLFAHFTACDSKSSSKESAPPARNSDDQSADPGLTDSGDQGVITGEKGAEIVVKPQTVGVLELVKQGDLEGVRLALEESAQINSRDDQGRTPLMLAALYNHLSICKLLVDRGADLTLRDNDGMDVVSLAESYGYQHIVLYLRQAGSPNVPAGGGPGEPGSDPAGAGAGNSQDPAPDSRPVLSDEQRLELNQRLLESCEKGEIDNIRTFIELGADADFTDELKFSGMTPLFLAISKANVDLVTLLVDLGADVGKRVKLRRLGEKLPVEYAQYLLQKEGPSSPAKERFSAIIAKLGGETV